MCVTNYGWIGSDQSFGYLIKPPDRPCRIGFIPGLSDTLGAFPRGSHTFYMYEGAIWVGAVVEGDTLVSTGWGQGSAVQFEFRPDAPPSGEIRHLSTIDPHSSDYVGAVSEEDYIAVCTDTFRTGNVPLLDPDPIDRRPHHPIPVEVTLKSHAWSEQYADDFVLFDYHIRNIGTRPAHDVYFGLQIDAGSWYRRDDFNYSGTDDDEICGYLRAYKSFKKCGFMDTLRIGWWADNDGDPLDGRFVNTRSSFSVTAVAGTMLLAEPDPFEVRSWNWWTNYWWTPSETFGPRRRQTIGRPYRDFTTGGTGVPEGDRNADHVMSSGEIDYDLIDISSISVADPVWMTPSSVEKQELFEGGFITTLLSAGPYELEPGEEVSVPIAYVAGENFHRDPNNGNLLKLGRPKEYYANLDFSDMAKNAMWAKWVYDNPGVDTDSDGYAGEYRVCVLDSALVNGRWVASLADTSWYKGDGVPDWRAVTPPPAPRFWLQAVDHGIRVRFNGRLSETTKDAFTNILDFEGYRIYFGRDDREPSLSPVASYDIEDYDKYVYDPRTTGYAIPDNPFTLQQLRCLCGSGPDPCSDSTFDPLAYSAIHPYFVGGNRDSLVYFTPHDNNSSRFGVTSPIKRIYPDAVKPVGSDTLKPEVLTPDGYLKYYEYEFTIENLLPTVPYYINVTAFDFGSPTMGVPAQESPKLAGIQHAYPLGQASDSAANRKVYVYPNPYLATGDYRSQGYEGRGQIYDIDDRVRAIHFANLPAKCTIKIFTIAGDLVREIRHDVNPSDPNSTHDTWNMINKNAEMIVSGLYYWSVENADGGVQIGKLAVIF